MPTAYLSPSQLQDLTNVSDTAPGSGDNGKALVWNWNGTTGTGQWQAQQVAYSNLSGAPTLGTMAAQNANTVAITGGSASGLSSIGAQVFSDGILTRNLWDYSGTGFGSSLDISATVDRLYRADKLFSVTTNNINSVANCFDGEPETFLVVSPTPTNESPIEATIEIDATLGLVGTTNGFNYGIGTIAVTNYPNTSAGGSYKIELYHATSSALTTFNWSVLVENESFISSGLKVTKYFSVGGQYLYVKKIKFTFNCINFTWISNLRYYPARTFVGELRALQIDPVGLSQKLIDTTNSTNTTSGALQVAGGVGIAGALHVGGQINGLGAVQPGTPASSTAAGSAGQIRWDADYIYACTATNTWKRVAISTW